MAGGRYRAMISGLGGRVALPGAYAAARRGGSRSCSGPRSGSTPAPRPTGWPGWPPPPVPPRRRRGHLRRRTSAATSSATAAARGNVFVAPQAVDVEHFGAPVRRRTDAAARERAGAGRATRCSCSWAAWRPRRAWTCCWTPGAPPASTGARLALAGTGPLEAEAAAGPAVRCLGYVAASQLPALYAAADALVLPSVATATFVEPWGLVVNEAMLQQHTRHSQRCRGRRSRRPGGRRPQRPRGPGRRCRCPRGACCRDSPRRPDRARPWPFGAEPPLWSWIRRPGRTACGRPWTPS